MLNLSKLKSSRTNRYAGMTGTKKGNNKDTFPWTNPSAFKPGSYPIRVLPRDMTKCPNGFHVYSKFMVEKNPGDDPVPVLAMESYQPGEDDTIADIIECYEEVKEHLPKSVCSAIESMKPNRYYLFPCAVRAKTVLKDNGYTDLYPDSNAEEFGIIWALTQDSIISRLETISEMYPTMSMETDQGRYLLFKRTGEGLQTRYTLDAMPDATPLGNPNILSDYPDFTKFGKKIQKDNYEREALVKSCWWWEHLSEYIEL